MKEEEEEMEDKDDIRGGRGGIRGFGHIRTMFMYLLRFHFCILH